MFEYGLSVSVVLKPDDMNKVGNPDQNEQTTASYNI